MAGSVLLEEGHDVRVPLVLEDARHHLHVATGTDGSSPSGRSPRWRSGPGSPGSTAVYLLLFAAFNSTRLALLVLINVPFAAVGGVWALLVSRLNLSVSAMVGFVALLGVSVMNGVLLVQRIRDLRREGYEAETAVCDGALSRFRPVLMTALMAELGLLPAALSTAVGAETQRPFAVVIIGGLVTATLLTLFVLPVLYRAFDTETPEY